MSKVKKGTLTGKKEEIINVESNKLKYLARSYICRVSELQTDKMSPKLLEAIIEPKSSEEQASIESKLTHGTEE